MRESGCPGSSRLQSETERKSGSVSIEISSDKAKIEALLELMKGFGIIEVVRTGRIAMGMGSKGLSAEGKPEVNE